MTHEELKQKVFSLAKNLEGIYDIKVTESTRYEFPLFKEKTWYEIDLKFDPWIRNNISIGSSDTAHLFSQLATFIEQPINPVVEQLINAKVF